MNNKALQYKNILNLISDGSIRQVDAAISLDLSYRHTRRRYRRYLESGESILTHIAVGCSNRYPIVVKEAILKLYQDQYWDFGPTLAAEQLSEADHYRITAETLRLWLKAAGLWACRRKRKGYRSRRERRSRFGELLQLDGSIHAWLPGVAGKQCLMNMVDDATGKTLSFMD